MSITVSPNSASNVVLSARQLKLLWRSSKIKLFSLRRQRRSRCSLRLYKPLKYPLKVRKDHLLLVPSFDTNAIQSLTSGDAGTLLTWNGSTYAPSNVLTQNSQLLRRVLNVHSNNQDKNAELHQAQRGAPGSLKQAESWHSTRIHLTRSFITAMATMAVGTPRQSSLLPVKTYPTVALQTAVSLSTKLARPGRLVNA